MESEIEATEARIAELDRQVERGSFFTQAVFQRGFRRIDQAESLLSGLIDALAAKGVISPEEVGVTFDDDEAGDVADSGGDGEREQASEETEQDAQPGITWPSVTLRVPPAEEPDEPVVVVDCDARMPVCHGVCCKLKFPLSCAEVDAGKVKWDIGHPYVIRQESSGYCTHNDTETGRCGVYADRPGICRSYSCADDTRIWTDFDNMVLNQEWIDEHLGSRDLRVEAVIPSMDVPVEISPHPSARAG
jgi:Fe-S-cluster containining protein